MDIKEINSNTFDIDFEILNWSDSPIHKVEFVMTNPNMGNIVFSGSSIEPNGRPFDFIDIDNDTIFPPADTDDLEDTNNDGIVDSGEDKNANDRFDNDEAPGNLNTVNDWTPVAPSSTVAVFTAGTPIPNIDLLSATSTAQANALLPNWPVPIDANGVLDNFEDIDNGINVLDGFVVRVTDVDDLETFNMNWYLYDVNDDLIGTPQGGNAMGFGAITLSYLENAGPNPSSPFVGLPSLATDPRDFYGQVYNVNSNFVAQTLPGLLGPGGPPTAGNPPPTGPIVTEVPNGFSGTGEVIIFNPNPTDDPFFHFVNGGFDVDFFQDLLITRDPIPGDTGVLDDLFPGNIANLADSNELVGDMFAISSSNTGGGTLGTDVFLDLLLGDTGGGTGTAAFVGGGHPPPDTQTDVLFEVRNRTLPADFDFLGNPGPDTLRDGQIINFGFTDPMDTSQLPTDLNTNFEIFDNNNGIAVPIPDGTIIPSWSDDQHFQAILQNTAGINIVEPVGQFSFRMTNTPLLDAKGDLVSQTSESGVGVGSLGGPVPECDLNPSGITVIDEDCDIRNSSFGGGDIEVSAGVLVRVFPGAFLCADLDLHKITVRNTAGIDILNGGGVGDDSAFLTCP